MYENIPAPVYYKGLVYVMSDATHLIALDATTGKLLWTFTFPPFANIDPYYAFSAPIITNGTIYCSDNMSTYLLDAASGIQKGLLSSSGVPLAITNNLIISSSGAFDINAGSAKWNTTTGIGSVFGQCNGAVIAERDSLYYFYRQGSSNTNAESLLLCALNINTGQQKWVISDYFDTYLYNGVIVNNSMYVTTTRIDAIDLYTGKIKWTNNNVPSYLNAICVVGASGRAYWSYGH